MNHWSSGYGQQFVLHPEILAELSIISLGLNSHPAPAACAGESPVTGDNGHEDADGWATAAVSTALLTAHFMNN